MNSKYWLRISCFVKNSLSSVMDGYYIFWYTFSGFSNVKILCLGLPRVAETYKNGQGVFFMF